MKRPFICLQLFSERRVKEENWGEMRERREGVGGRLNAEPSKADVVGWKFLGKCYFRSSNSLQFFCFLIVADIIFSEFKTRMFGVSCFILCTDRYSRWIDKQRKKQRETERQLDKNTSILKKTFITFVENQLLVINQICKL